MDRTVDIYTHESDMARMERSNARLSFLCITLIVILLATNGGWLYYESQYTEIASTYEVEQAVENETGNAIITDGVHINDGTNNAASESNN